MKWLWRLQDMLARYGKKRALIHNADAMPCTPLSHIAKPSYSNDASAQEAFATYLTQQLEQEKAVLPFDLLGRSLSYNPYPPRFKELFPTLKPLAPSSYDNAPSHDNAHGIAHITQASSVQEASNADDASIQALLVRGFVFDDLDMIIAHHPPIIVLDMARDDMAMPRGEGLECIGYLRHYTDALIVLKDCFYDKYQILQAVVYGADGIVLEHRSKQAKELIALACKLNLMSFSEIIERKDITRAVLARSEGFFINNAIYDEVASLIPSNKCLCRYYTSQDLNTSKTPLQRPLSRKADIVCLHHA